MNDQASLPRDLSASSGDRPPPPSPRALRAMAIVRWVLLAIVSLTAAYTVWTFWGPRSTSGEGTASADRYYCAMHPQIRSPEPGECPICHMSLVPIPEERKGETPSAASPAPAGGAMAEVTAITVSEEEQRAVGLATSVVENATLGARARAPGVVTAPESGLSQVRVRAPGFIERVLVSQSGVRVSRGQTLAFVYSPDIYRAQEEFLATLRWKGAGANPGENNLGVASRRALELLGLSTDDVAQIAQSGEPLRAVPVRAPAAGYVTRFNAVLGARAEPESVLYEIADLSSVWVVANVHEHELGGLRVGTRARFVPSGAPERASTARVQVIEPMLDEMTRTARVRLVVANPSGALRPGEFGDVDFELPASEGLFVPRDAVIHTGEHDYVYVATGTDRFEPRPVRTGITREDRVAVLEGLAPGERIVTRGSFMLDSESRLQASLTANPGGPSASPASSPAALPHHHPASDHAEHGEERR